MGFQGLEVFGDQFSAQVKGPKFGKKSAKDPKP